RRALQQLEPVRQKDAQERPELDVEQPLHGSPVGAHQLHRTRVSVGRSEADAQLVRALAVAALNDNAGGLLSEAHELALVAGAWRTGGASVIERLQQVRLAGAVRPVYDRQARPETGLGACVGAEVAHLHADEVHLAILT